MKILVCTLSATLITAIIYYNTRTIHYCFNHGGYRLLSYYGILDLKTKRIEFEAMFCNDGTFIMVDHKK